MTTGGICQVPDCGSLLADAHVCAACAHRLTQALDDVPDLVEELETDLARLGRRGGRVGGRDAETPLPIDLGASIVRGALAGTLATWARVLHGDVLAPTSGLDDPAAAARFLVERVEQIRHHPAGGALVDEACAAVDGARDQVHGPARSGPSALLGLCPDCGDALYGSQAARDARCRRDGCGGWVEAAAWRYDAIQALRGAVLPAADAARAAALVTGREISADLVRQWRRRGRIQPADHDPATGRPRYAVADLLQLIAPTERNAS